MTFLASTGDSGARADYPAYSPNVVAVGGTTLTLSGNNTSGETGWSDSGGGPSIYESKPSYQNSRAESAKREIPDVAFDADPDSGVAVYDTYDTAAAAPGMQVGGTSFRRRAGPAWWPWPISSACRRAWRRWTAPRRPCPNLYALSGRRFP